VPTSTIPHVGFRTVNGVRVRYADSGSPHKPAIVLTSPWPESLYAFAPMWAALSGHARLFAFDLPGFGASGRREDLLSPQAMGEFLAQLIAAADLGRAHLVAPDVGTSAALFAAAAHPERLASVVVGSGGAAIPIQLGEPLASWILDPDLDKYRKIDPHVIVNTAVDTNVGGVPDDIRQDYLACYEGDRFRRIDALGPPVSRGAAGAGRVAAADQRASHDHQRPARPRRAGGQRGVSRPAAARQPPGDTRRRSLRVGGRACQVRHGHPRLDHAQLAACVNAFLTGDG
jgi:pimeloyl-ACP methyl ester carboxylesterase